MRSFCGRFNWIRHKTHHVLSYRHALTPHKPIWQEDCLCHLKDGPKVVLGLPAGMFVFYGEQQSACQLKFHHQSTKRLMMKRRLSAPVSVVGGMYPEHTDEVMCETDWWQPPLFPSVLAWNDAYSPSLTLRWVLDYDGQSVPGLFWLLGPSH